MMIEFMVLGEPKPGGSKKYVGRNGMGRAIIIDAAKNKDWRQAVVSCATAAYQGPLLEGPLRLDVTFYKVRPLGHFRSGKNAGLLKESAPVFPTTAPDVTKLMRSTEDALTKIIWRDDAQIVTQTAKKVFAERPGAHIKICSVDFTL